MDGLGSSSMSNTVQHSTEFGGLHAIPKSLGCSLPTLILEQNPSIKTNNKTTKKQTKPNQTKTTAKTPKASFCHALCQNKQLFLKAQEIIPFIDASSLQALCREGAGNSHG